MNGADDDDFAPPAPTEVKHVVPREVWELVLAMADERGDLRPLAQLLEARVPLPAAVREHLAYMFRDRRLQPRQPLVTDYKRTIVQQAKRLYDKSGRQQGETAEQHRVRFARDYNDKHFKNPKNWGPQHPDYLAVAEQLLKFKRRPRETDDKYRVRLVRELNEGRIKMPGRWRHLRVTEAALKGLTRGTSRLARQRQKPPAPRR
jgi:hypothetical protein